MLYVSINVIILKLRDQIGSTDFSFAIVGRMAVEKIVFQSWYEELYIDHFDGTWPNAIFSCQIL